MGFSSFMTDDTHETIWNVYTENPTKIKILLPWGVYRENVTNDGYMRFGGEDYFELLAKESGYTFDESNPEYLRDMGLELFYSHEDSVQYPKLVTMGYEGKYSDLPHGRPVFCPLQGYFNE